MKVRIDGTETLADLREAMSYLADLKLFMPNAAAKRAIDTQIDDLLDAELALKQTEFLREYERELAPRRQSGDY